jgi:hypothetical protein
MILLRRYLESINIIFTCGDSKNHQWPVHLLSEDVSSLEDASTSWPSTSGLKGHSRTYLTILESDDHALFKMAGARGVFPSSMNRPTVSSPHS